MKAAINNWNKTVHFVQLVPSEGKIIKVKTISIDFENVSGNFFKKFCLTAQYLR